MQTVLAHAHLPSEFHKLVSNKTRHGSPLKSVSGLAVVNASMVGDASTDTVICTRGLPCPRQRAQLEVRSTDAIEPYETTVD